MDFSSTIIYIIFLWLIFILNGGCVDSYYRNKIESSSTAEILRDDIFFEIVEPSDLSYTYRTRPAKEFGSEFNVNFAGKNARLVPTEPYDACSKIKNRKILKGHVALIVRGSCSFVTKTLNAQKAGATGVIIADNALSEEFYIDMGDDRSGISVDIPATFILGKNGHMIRKTLLEKKLDYAVINIPVNLTYVSIDKMNQPPWLAW